jgi:hypothetical protein
MNPTLIALVIALALGIAADGLVTRATKVGWLGTVIGMAVFAVGAIIALGLS